MQKADILDLLPEVFRRSALPGNALDLVVEIMVRNLAQVEDQVAHFPSQLRSDIADRDFVFYLAHLMDLDRYFVKSLAGDSARSKRETEFAAGVAQLRRLIEDAPQLSRLRGTKEGLVRFLERATGRQGFVVDDTVGADSQQRSFHIRVTAPGDAHWFRELVQRIVEAEKPAYVTHDIVFLPGASKAGDT